MKKIQTLLLLCFCMSTAATYAELKELDDKKLKEQEAKAGITIDIETQLEIGEVYWDFSNNGGKNKPRKTSYMPKVIDPITYDIPKK